MCNFMKGLRTCLISKDFNFIFISIEKKIFWIYPKFDGENPGTYHNLIAHVL